jgi:hypothetical protein
VLMLAAEGLVNNKPESALKPSLNPFATFALLLSHNPL